MIVNRKGAENSSMIRKSHKIIPLQRMLLLIRKNLKNDDIRVHAVFDGTNKSEVIMID